MTTSSKGNRAEGAVAERAVTECGITVFIGISRWVSGEEAG